MALHYLTVQDVLNLSMRITGSPQEFEYARLEEAVYYQYSPGQSTDLFRQAARFLTGFVHMSPFSSGNAPVAFAAVLVFLRANGQSLALADAESSSWVTPLLPDRKLAEDRLRARSAPYETDFEHGVPELDRISEDVIVQYPLTIASLLEENKVA